MARVAVEAVLVGSRLLGRRVVRRLVCCCGMVRGLGFSRSLGPCSNELLLLLMTVGAALAGWGEPVRGVAVLTGLMSGRQRPRFGGRRPIRMTGRAQIGKLGSRAVHFVAHFAARVPRVLRRDQLPADSGVATAAVLPCHALGGLGSVRVVAQPARVYCPVDHIRIDDRRLQRVGESLTAVWGFQSPMATLAVRP